MWFPTQFNWSLLLSLAVLVSACSPPAPPLLRRYLSPQQVRQDLTLLQRLKETAHAGSYKYHAKSQIDSAFDAVRARVTTPLTVLEVYRLVITLTDFEGSLHNDTSLPQVVRDSMRAQPVFFPYPLKLVAGHVLLNSTHAPLPLGARICSVNGIPTRRLVRELGKYYTTDGVNTTGKRVGFAADFPEYYRLEYGPATAFVVRYTRPAQLDTLRQTLPAVSYQHYQQAFAARHSRPYDRSWFEGTPQPYTFRVLPGQSAAVLTINTFDLGEDQTPGHRRYQAFLDSCFTLLRRAPRICQLLLDVRGNGGGDDNNDMLAFAYLAHAPFRENKGATVRFQRVPYRQYLAVERDTAERASIVQEVSQELRANFRLGADGQLHQTARDNPVFQPQPNRFRGRLYLLISPRVASAGSMFAAMVRGNTPAVLIGQETMGGYYGHTGHQSLAYTLPHSGLECRFSWVDLVQDVPVRPTQPFGHGSLPDYVVEQSEADFLANRDTELAAALRHLAAKSRPGGAASAKLRKRPLRVGF